MTEVPMGRCLICNSDNLEFKKFINHKKTKKHLKQLESLEHFPLIAFEFIGQRKFIQRTLFYYYLI